MSSIKTTQYAILGLLTIKPMSGYDLGKNLRESLGFFWTESNGQLYPTLKRLVADGLIVPAKTQQSGRRARQRYALTPAGHQRLKRWLAEPPQLQPPRNELILKLFLGRSAPNGALVQHIRSSKARHEESIATFVKLRERIPKENTQSPDLAYWMLCLEHGIRLRQAEIDWCSAALAALDMISRRNRQRRSPTRRTSLESP